MPSRSRAILGGFFLVAGALHFLKPRPYEAIMPEPLLWARLPLQAAIVYWIRRVTSAATPG